jgi:hypothetical protein
MGNVRIDKVFYKVNIGGFGVCDYVQPVMKRMLGTFIACAVKE